MKKFGGREKDVRDLRRALATRGLLASKGILTALSYSIKLETSDNSPSSTRMWYELFFNHPHSLTRFSRSPPSLLRIAI